MRETTIETGAVRGVACGWPSITAFYGIPYAAPPVGELRWRPPQPAAPWEGIRDCARPGPRCPQAGVSGDFYKREFYPMEEPMSEDCLYLTVWTPARSTEEKLPVIFWIHGGAYVTGYGHSAHFDGEHFARQGVILVTINYRLNIFGWMVHPELSAENERGISGNYGLMDQIFALKWVRRNIAAFGGDPDKITIAGQSAGAMSVTCLLHSPVVKGDFRGAIMQSGGGFLGFPDMSHYRTVREAEERAGLKGELGVDTIAEARALSGQELLERWLKTGFGRSRLQACPVIDGYILDKPLEETALSGAYSPVPTLLGCTAEENVPTMPTPEIFRTVMKKEFGEKAAEFFKLCPLEDEAEWKKFMFSNCTELLRSSCEAWARLVERQGAAPAYVYSLTRRPPGDDAGAFHASDLMYVFKTFLRSWRPWTGQDYEIATAMNTYWANFAKYGTPNGPNGLNDKKLPAWVPFSAESELTMEFGDDIIGMRKQPENERVSFRVKALLGT